MPLLLGLVGEVLDLKGLKILCLALALSIMVGGVGLAEDVGPIYGGRLTIGMPVAPQGRFNPLVSTSKYDQDIIKHVFNGLIEVGPDMSYVPSLAEKWEFSEDGCEWTFYLRRDVKWHDGHDFTSRDVVFTLTTLLHPAYYGGKGADFLFIEGAQEFKAGKASSVSGIEAIDDYMVKIRLREPFAPFMESITFPILPEHILKDVSIREMDRAVFNLQPIGTGPYMFIRYVDGQYAELEANESYFKGRPYIDKLFYKVITNEDAMVAALKNNEIQVAEFQPRYVEQVQAMPNIKLYKYLAHTDGYVYMGLNLRKPFFQSDKVRQAIAYAIPRHLFVTSILKGYGQVANTPISPLSWAYSRDVNEYQYDPVYAARLLDEAGWHQGSDGLRRKDGQVFEFQLKYPAGDKIREALATVVQGSLRGLGIRVNLVPTEPNALALNAFPKLFGNTLKEPDFDAYILGWTLYTVDPDPFTIWYSSSPYNGVGFNSSISDELIVKGRTTLDLTERREIYFTWQEMINDQLPYIFMYFKTAVIGVNERVQGASEESLGFIWDVSRLWLLTEDK